MLTTDGHIVQVSDKEVIYVPSFNGSAFYCQQTTTSSGVATGKQWYKSKEICQGVCDNLNKKK